MSTILAQGQFTSAGVGVKIPLACSADYFIARNITQLALHPATGVCVQSEWYPNYADNDGLQWKKTNSTNALNINSFAAESANGFTYITSVPFVEAAVTGGTAITQAASAVVTLTNTFSEGDRVRLYNTTGMLQIAGMDFTISSVSGSGFTLSGLDSSGFAAAATAVTARRISSMDAVEPRYLYITKISQATQAVITVSCLHNYVVGELVYFNVPQSFGMQEISGQTGKITAVTDYTMTIDIDSSAYTAFAFPASSAVPTTQLFATLAPAGQRAQYNTVSGVQTGYNFDYVPFHTGQTTPYMYLAAGADSPAGVTNDVIVWQAWKSTTGIIS